MALRRKIYNGFDAKFIKLFKRKLSDKGYKGDYREKFGLKEDQLVTLQYQVESNLMPVIRASEKFDLLKVIGRFNRILPDKRFE